MRTHFFPATNPHQHPRVQLSKGKAPVGSKDNLSQEVLLHTKVCLGAYSQRRWQKAGLKLSERVSVSSPASIQTLHLLRVNSDTYQPRLTEGRHTRAQHCYQNTRQFRHPPQLTPVTAQQKHLFPLPYPLWNSTQQRAGGGGESPPRLRIPR